MKAMNWVLPAILIQNGIWWGIIPGWYGVLCNTIIASWHIFHWFNNRWMICDWKVYAR